MSLRALQPVMEIDVPVVIEVRLDTPNPRPLLRLKPHVGAPLETKIAASLEETNLGVEPVANLRKADTVVPPLAGVLVPHRTCVIGPSLVLRRIGACEKGGQPSVR